MKQGSYVVGFAPRGDQRLNLPDSERWSTTEPITTHVCRPSKHAEPFGDICSNTMYRIRQRGSWYYSRRYRDFSRASVGGVITCGPRDSEGQVFSWHEARVVARRQFNSVHRASTFQTLLEHHHLFSSAGPLSLPCVFHCEAGRSLSGCR
jgi:hypothetical protein